MKPVIIPGSFDILNKNAIDWGPHNLLLYGCQNLVTIIDSSLKKIVCVLERHCDVVTHVKWKPLNQLNLANLNSNDVFHNVIALSCDSTSKIIIWDIVSGSYLNEIDGQFSPIHKGKHAQIIDIQWVPSPFLCPPDYILAVRQSNVQPPQLHNNNSTSSIILWHAMSGDKLWEYDMADIVKGLAFDPFDHTRFLVNGPGYVTLYRDFDPKRPLVSEGPAVYPKGTLGDNYRRPKLPKKFLLTSSTIKILEGSRNSSTNTKLATGKNLAFALPSLDKDAQVKGKHDVSIIPDDSNNRYPKVEGSRTFRKDLKLSVGDGGYDTPLGQGSESRISNFFRKGVKSFLIGSSAPEDVSDGKKHLPESAYLPSPISQTPLLSPTSNLNERISDMAQSGFKRAGELLNLQSSTSFDDFTLHVSSAVTKSQSFLSPKDGSKILIDSPQTSIRDSSTIPYRTRTNSHGGDRETTCLQLVWSRVWRNVFYLVYPSEIVALVLENDGCALYNPCSGGSLIKAHREDPFTRLLIPANDSSSYSMDFGEAMYTVTVSGVIQLRFQSKFRNFMRSQLLDVTNDLSGIYSYIDNYTTATACGKSDQSLNSLFSSFAVVGTSSSKLLAPQRSGVGWGGLAGDTVLGACLSPIDASAIAILSRDRPHGHVTTSRGTAAAPNNQTVAARLIILQVELCDRCILPKVPAQNLPEAGFKLIEQPNIFAPLPMSQPETSYPTEPDKIKCPDEGIRADLPALSTIIIKFCEVSKDSIKSEPSKREGPSLIKFSLVAVVQGLTHSPTVLSVRPPIFDTAHGPVDFRDGSLVAIGTTSGSIQIFNLTKNCLLREFGTVHEHAIKKLFWIAPRSLISYSCGESSPTFINSPGHTRNDVVYLDIETGFTYPVRQGQNDTSTFRIFKVSGSGKYLILTFQDPRQPPELWNLTSFTLVRRFPKNFPRIVNLAWNQSSKYDTAVAPKLRTDDGPNESFVFSDTRDQTFYFSIGSNVIRKGIKLPPHHVIPSTPPLPNSANPSATPSDTSTHRANGAPLAKMRAPTFTSLSFHHPSTALVMARRDGTCLVRREPLRGLDGRPSHVTGPDTSTLSLANFSASTRVGRPVERITGVYFSPPRIHSNVSYSSVPFASKVLVFTNERLEVWDVQEGIRIFHSFHCPDVSGSRHTLIKDVAWVSADYLVYLTATGGSLHVTDHSLKNLGDLSPSPSGYIDRTADFLGSYLDGGRYLGRRFGGGDRSFPIYREDAPVRRPFTPALLQQYGTFVKWLICNFPPQPDPNLRLSPYSKGAVEALAPLEPKDHDSWTPTITHMIIEDLGKLTVRNALTESSPSYGTFQRCIVASRWFDCQPQETQFWEYALDCVILSSRHQTGAKALSTFSFMYSMSGGFLEDNEVFKRYELTRLVFRMLNYKSPTPTSDKTINCANIFLDEVLTPLDELKWIGLNREVVRHFVESENSGFEAAFFASAPTSDENSHATVKLVATNLIASGNLKDGVAMLCCIGKCLDACLYLQSHGYWEKAVWLAKMTLSPREYVQIIDRWANHLSLNNSQLCFYTSMLYLHVSEYEKACSSLTRGSRGDMAYLLYKGLREWGLMGCPAARDGVRARADTELGNGDAQAPPIDEEPNLADEVSVAYVNYLLEFGNKRAAASYFNMTAAS